MPSSAPPLAVTGSSGQVGGCITHRLAAAGVPQRLLVRDPARTPGLPGSTVAVAPYDDGAAVRAALAGTSVVLVDG